MTDDPSTSAPGSPREDSDDPVQDDAKSQTFEVDYWLAENLRGTAHLTCPQVTIPAIMSHLREMTTFLEHTFPPMAQLQNRRPDKDGWCETVLVFTDDDFDEMIEFQDQLDRHLSLLRVACDKLLDLKAVYTSTEGFVWRMAQLQRHAIRSPVFSVDGDTT